MGIPLVAKFGLLRPLLCVFKSLSLVKNLDCRIINHNIFIVVVNRCLRRLPQDNFRSWWKFCYFDGLHPIKCSFFNIKFGPQSGPFCLHCYVCPVVDFVFVMSVFWAEEAFCLLHCSNAAFALGVVHSAPELIGWVDNSGFFVNSVFCNDIFAILGVIIFVTIWVCLTTAFISFARNNLINSLVFFAAMTCRLRVSRVSFCGMLRLSVHSKFIWGSETIEFEVPSKMWRNLFNSAVLQVNLIDCFSQVWRQLGMYELLKNCLQQLWTRLFHFLEFVQKLKIRLGLSTED